MMQLRSVTVIVGCPQSSDGSQSSALATVADAVSTGRTGAGGWFEPGFRHDAAMILPAATLRLLERQFGVIARGQLLDAIPAHRIDGLLRRKLLVSLERGVYRSFGSAVTPQTRAMAALLRAGRGSCLTGPFVLGLFDVDGFTVDDPFEVLVRPGRRLRGVAFPHRRNPTPNTPVARRGPLIVAPITAALVDTGRLLGAGEDRRLRVAYDHSRWRGWTSADRVAARVEALGPRDAGAARFERLRVDYGLRPESDGERFVGRALAGIDPPPQSQVWVGPYRIDWYWPLYHVGLEYQGGVDHAGATARERDERRAADLARRGVQILTVTAADVRDEAHLRSWVHAALVVRAHEYGVPLPTVRG